MPWNEFWNMTWQEFYYQVSGYYEREKDEWRKFREVVTMIYNSVASQKKSSQQLMPIDGEDQFNEEAIEDHKNNYWKWRKSMTIEEYEDYNRKLFQSIQKNKN